MTHRGMLLRLDDFVGGYVEMVGQVMERGVEAAPRGALTREVLAATIVVPAWAPFLPVGTGRGVSVKLAAEEALQLIGGYSDAEAMFRVSPHMRDFADQGAFHGAYGPRLRAQLELCWRRLTEDPLTRRAVATIWDPSRDSVEGVRNYPCTTEIQFMLRPVSQSRVSVIPHALDMHVTMRANDAWHGLAYDAFFFNQLQHSMARALHLPVGAYYHHATSLHVYEEQWSSVGKLYPPKAAPAPLASGIGVPGQGWLAAAQRARNIADGVLTYADPSERWYSDQHAKVMGAEP